MNLSLEAPVFKQQAVQMQILQKKAVVKGVTLDTLLTPLLEGPQPIRNAAMFAAFERSAVRMKDVPVRGATAETLKLLRAGRAGETWGA